jgi:anti-anti-sigma factor
VTLARVSHDGTAGSGWPVVVLTGEVDLSNVDDLAVALQQAVPNDATGLVLDLSGVSYLDSTGLRLLFGLARKLSDRQQRLHLVVPQGSVISKVLDLGGVRHVAALVHSRADAVDRNQEGKA